MKLLPSQELLSIFRQEERDALTDPINILKAFFRYGYLTCLGLQVSCTILKIQRLQLNKAQLIAYQQVIEKMFQIRRGAQMLGQHKGHRIAGQMIHNLL